MPERRSWTWHSKLSARTRCKLQEYLDKLNADRAVLGDPEITLWKLAEITKIDYRLLKKMAADDAETFTGAVQATLVLTLRCHYDDLFEAVVDTKKIRAVSKEKKEEDSNSEEDSIENGPLDEELASIAG